MAEIVIALDLPGDEARRLLDRIPQASWVKVGSILFAREGPGFIKELIGRGLRVFLDLKWHDIPKTVAGVVQAASELGVTMASVHTLGGTGMLEAAARAAGPQLGLVGVTVLTSHTPATYGSAVGRNRISVPDEVRRLADAAVRAGLKGVVCSPHEAAVVRLAGPTWLVVPGIRRNADPAGDQARTATPGEAAAAGATHLVVGRPILTAGDPEAVFQEMLREAS